MSTFMFQNGLLYADTRKIVNWPQAEMIGTVQESKVLKLGWSYLAIGGLGDDPETQWKISSSVAALQVIYELFFNIERLGYNLDKTPFLNDVKIIGALVRDALCVRLKDHEFLAVTQTHVISKKGESDDGVEKLIIQPVSKAKEAVGSCRSAARILMHHGVHPSEIYSILRHGNAPVGEHFEVFEHKALDTRQAPWMDYLIYVRMVTYIKKFTPDVFNGNNVDIMTDLCFYFSMMTKGYNRTTHHNNPKDKQLRAMVDNWSDKAFRGLFDYAELKEILV